MIIKLSNNIEYPVIYPEDPATRVEPSGSQGFRSKMYIYMRENEMTLAEFIRLFEDEKNLEKITFKGEKPDGGTFEEIFSNYTFVQSVGKETITYADPSTGRPIEIRCLVAKLEQLTYTEQQLKKLKKQGLI